MRTEAANFVRWQRLCASVCLICFGLSTSSAAQSPSLRWSALPPLPDELGLAGPIVGVFDGLLVAAGGANFARPVWDNPKRWHERMYVLDLRRDSQAWTMVGQLPKPLAYAACASTPYGIAMLGGNDQSHVSSSCHLIKASRQNDQYEIVFEALPDLPQPIVYGQAVWVKDTLIVLSGQEGVELTSALAGGWKLSFRQPGDKRQWAWQRVVDCPGGPRAFAMACPLGLQPDQSQLLLMGGRRDKAGAAEFLRDVWQYDTETERWTQMPDLPVPVSAGGAGCVRDGWIAVLSGDDGQLFTQTDKLKDNHPGFARRTWLFELATGRWQAGGVSPANQVTTPPVSLADQILLISGEVRPRVRTNQAWSIRLDK